MYFVFLKQLIDAVARQLIERTILVLAYCSPEHVSAPYSKTDTRTALHIASALANPILIQLLIWVGTVCDCNDHFISASFDKCTVKYCV